MPRFNTSILKALDYQPWRYTTQPTYNPDGSEATPGVKQFANGAFVLLSDEIIDFMRDKLTAAEKLELADWIDRRSAAQCAIWHVPMWEANAPGAVYLRIPASEMADPSSPVTAKVARYFANLYA